MDSKRMLRAGDRRIVDRDIWTGSARQTSLAWIARGMVHFVASDAHNLSGAPAQVARGLRCGAERNSDEEKAEALFVENPLAAFEGRPLPHVPEIVEEHAKEETLSVFLIALPHGSESRRTRILRCLGHCVW